MAKKTQSAENDLNFRSRSTAGAWFLIIIGTLFLLQNYISIDLGKLWPLILIGIGLVLLSKK